MIADAATARHVHEQRLDLERRKRLEAAERAREKRDDPNGTLHRVRIGDLNKMLGACYGAEAINYQFADDDAGRIDAMILAQHYANGNPSALARVLRARLPWMDGAEFHDLIEEAHENPRFWGAQELAFALQLTDERRTALNIKSIGCIDMTKRQRQRRRKAQNTERRRAKRRANDVTPREEYLAEHTTNRDKPWLALKISKATYYRRGLHLTQVDSETSPSAMKLVSVTEDAPVSLSERKRRGKTEQHMNTGKSNHNNPATALLEPIEWREAA
jgi:hypothetical protein